MGSKASVLIVDDEQFLRQILGRIVAREGFAVEEAIDGKDALKKIQEKTYDFVISDIRMPNLDGIELLNRIKQDHKGITVILITAYAGQYTAQDALKAGADYYITKPFKNVEIARTLNTLLVKRQALARRQEARR
ncbi:MAG TPA: response regulator [candidate division Zixibacteria bacterium]|nr:response regulator [candidate division Zixibacteria bacterium]